MEPSPIRPPDVRAAYVAAVPAAAPPSQQSLLEAGLAVAATLRHSGLSLDASAERYERADSVPYLVACGVMSTHVVNFLRALARAELARETGVPETEIEAPRPRYGPPLRESGS